ncbi:hypothetical protein AAFF_G00339580 [Aldrovandia affinis]|uniref:Uncharacterized protein n=1 Tax=Aldrovandia affinis TaxID=143900 RepID=A0AAD7SKR2_9TELE|nr:hypothetical protein AAFF_G00339580 [Aldrovandia affinis]
MADVGRPAVLTRGRLGTPERDKSGSAQRAARVHPGARLSSLLLQVWTGTETGTMRDTDVEGRRAGAFGGGEELGGGRPGPMARHSVLGPQTADFTLPTYTPRRTPTCPTPHLFSTALRVTAVLRFHGALSHIATPFPEPQMTGARRKGPTDTRRQPALSRLTLKPPHR